MFISPLFSASIDDHPRDAAVRVGYAFGKGRDANEVVGGILALGEDEAVHTNGRGTTAEHDRAGSPVDSGKLADPPRDGRKRKR